jgi:ceramide glucosyltransferase
MAGQVDLDLTNAAVASLALGTLSLGLSCAAQQCARWRLGARRALCDALPPLTVLKPIKGVDAGLRDNLEALVAQDYPDWELLIAIADRDDPAFGVAMDLQRAHPEQAIAIVTGAPDIGLNPKVCNLAHAAKEARHPLWLVSDADVRPHREYLRDMVAQREAGAHLVHSVLAASGEDSIGAAMDNAHLCAAIGPSVCAGDVLLGHPCVVGKSMLLHAADLGRLGGWRRYADVLAEDYLIGRDFHAAGMRVALCDRPLAVHTERRTVAAFYARHLRWAQMRRRMTPFLYAMEPLLYPTLWLVVALALALAAGAKLLGGAAAAGLAAKVALDVGMTRRIRGRALPAWTWPLIIAKDLLIAGAWCAAWMRSRVMWRGKRLRIGPGTELLVARERSMTAAASRAWRLAQRVLF